MKCLASSVLTVLFLTVATARAQVDDPSEWIKQLGSDREGVRAAAEKALEKQGRDVLPLLRVAADSRDTAIRSRAMVMIERIEGTLLLRPTMVVLDFQDRPLAEVVETIGRRSGLAFDLFPKDSPVWRQRRVTLHRREPVPFLEAVDRLCDAGQLHVNFWQSEEERGRPPVLHLVDGRRDRAPVSYDGPFRISLISIHDHHDLIFEQESRSTFNPRSDVPPSRSPQEQFSVRLQVMAEPRMTIRLDRALSWAEAVDVRGQSLVPTEAGSRTSGAVTMPAPFLISFPVPLRHLDSPGKAIRRLRGVVPVMVSARAPEPLLIPLKDAVGRKVEGLGISLEIREIRNIAGRPCEMKLFVRTDDSREDTGTPSTWLQNSQIELIDGQGQPSRARFSFAYVEKGLKAVTLSLVDGEAARTPVELRYYSLRRATAEVPFEFTDIEMP